MMVQTEIGLLPEDWEVVRLENVGSFTKGCGISRNDSQTGKIPAVRYGELYTDHNNYIKQFKSFISSEVAKTARKMKTGCILFTASGETKEDIGKAVAFLDDIEAYAGGDLIILNPKADYCSLYLGYTLNSLISVRQRAMVAQGDSVVHITTGAIRDTAIPVPYNLAEQQNIASALSSIDKLIDDLGRTIQKKQLIREGAMEELLSGKKRLPGFTEEWVEKKICEIGKLTGAGVDKTSNPNEEPVRLLNYLDVYRRNHIANCELHHKVTATPDKIEKCNVKRGDIFFTPSSELPDDIGQSAVAVEDMKGVCYSYHVYRLRPTMENYDADYGAYAFQTEFFFNQVKTQSEGSGKRYVVSLTKFRELSVMLPPSKDEQHAIANILTSMDDEISVLQIEKAKYEQIRSGMMEELLTGKKRLK